MLFNAGPYTQPMLNTYGSDLGELFVVLEEEREVLVGDVHVTVPSLLLVFLHCCAAAGECVLVDLKRKVPLFY